MLSPGGTQLAPGPNPSVENDDIKLIFAQPVSAVGFDFSSSPSTAAGIVSVQVFDTNGQVIYSNPSFPTGSAPGGVPGDSVFFGFVSPAKNIASVVINESTATTTSLESGVNTNSDDDF